MKRLKKINIGFILTILVVLAVVIYSVGLETSRGKDKGNIKTSIEEFTQKVCEYVILEENYQKYDNRMTDEEIEKYINEKIKVSLKEYMIDNEAAINIEKTQIQSDIENQINTNTYKTKVEQELRKISSYEFDGDQVTVTFNRKITEETKYFDMPENEYGEIIVTSDVIKTKTDTYNTSSETITLKKVDGKWKVVYANLQFNALPTGLGTMMIGL